MSFARRRNATGISCLAPAPNRRGEADAPLKSTISLQLSTLAPAVGCETENFCESARQVRIIGLTSGLILLISASYESKYFSYLCDATGKRNPQGKKVVHLYEKIWTIFYSRWTIQFGMSRCHSRHRTYRAGNVYCCKPRPEAFVR